MRRDKRAARFRRPARRRVRPGLYVVPAVANRAAPTMRELMAGVRISGVRGVTFS